MNPLAAAIEELNQARQQRRTSSAEPQPQGPESASDDGGGERNIESLITGRDPNSRPRIARFGNPFDMLIGAGRGGIQAVNETADLAAEIGDTQNNVQRAVLGAMPFGIGRAIQGFSELTRNLGLRKPDGEVADIPVPTEGEDTVTGRVSEAISQTIAGFYAGGRVLKAGQILQGGGRGIALARGLAAGGVGDFIAFDGNEERLSNLVEMVPQLRNPVTDFLAADEETPELLGRLKNTLEGVGVGLAFEAVLGVLRGTKALRRGDRVAVEAAVDEVEAASRTADEAALRAPPPAAPPRDRVASAAAQAGQAMRPLRRPPAEIPETVMGRDDVEAFLAEARANRPLSGQLNIKSGDIDGAAAKHGEWTLNTYGDPANLDATMRALVDRQGPAAPRSDTDLQSVALSAADELGMNPEEIMAAGYHIAGITGDIDTAVQTMRTLWARTARSVDDHVGKDLSQATDVEFATIVRDIHNAMVFGSYMARVKSAMGRGLRVFQLPDADTYAKTVAEGDALPGALRRGPRDAVQLPATREEAADWLELWGFARTSGVPNPTEVLHVVPGEWKYLRTSFANAFTAGVPSAPKTIALNVIGPGILGALRTIERTVGGYPAALVESLKGNKERAVELMAAASRSATAYMQTSADIGLAFRWAVEAGKRGRLILGGHGSVTDNAAQFGPLTDNLLRAAGREPGFGYVFGNLLNLFPRAFAHLNIGLDEFARRLAYLGEARIRAMAEGEAAGLKGADVDLGAEPAPDETTICRFRHLLEAHDLSARIFEDVLAHLEAKGMKIATGTIVDATIIHAPSSTKNKDRARDPEMHQTKKGNQWYLGMKAHLGVDSKSKLIHAVVATPANVHDGEVIGDLLHGNETRVWGDRAYQGKTEIIREHAPNAQDFTHRRCRRNGAVDEAERAKNRTKSKVRAKGEHPIGILKRVFGFAKVRYRGISKNADRLFVAAELANLFMTRKPLLRLAAA